jgi:hypothetical protein
MPHQWFNLDSKQSKNYIDESKSKKNDRKIIKKRRFYG